MSVHQWARHPIFSNNHTQHHERLQFHEICRHCLAHFSLLTASSLQAAGEKEKLIEELLVLTKAEQLFKVGQLEGFQVGLDMSPVPIPADKKTKIISAGKKIMDEEMPWSKVKLDYITLYGKHYTQEELKAVIALCKDPRYNLLVSKQIAILGPSMKIGEKYGKKMMPRMMQATMRIMQERLREPARPHWHGSQR